jgi:hypothetical protein
MQASRENPAQHVEAAICIEVNGSVESQEPDSPAHITISIVECSTKDIADAVKALGPAYHAYATELTAMCIDGKTISKLQDSTGLDRLSSLLTGLKVLDAVHRQELESIFARKTIQKSVSTADDTITLADIAEERENWFKACLILEVCTKSTRPFVGLVMEKLHKKVIDEAKVAILADLRCSDDQHLSFEDEVLDEEEWNCSTFPGVNDISFTENGPISLVIHAIDTDGIATSKVPHCLKPHSLHYCRLKNVPVGVFEHDVFSNAPAFMCPIPSDPASEFSFPFVLLRECDYDKLELLTPFKVFLAHQTKGDHSFECYAVLCESHPGYTELLVNSFLAHSLPSQARVSPVHFSYAFWTLKSHIIDDHVKQNKYDLKKGGNFYDEFKHGLKRGDFVTFDGSILPHRKGFDMSYGLRYLVTEETKFSFKIAGPILIPKSAFCADALSSKDKASFADNPFTLIRRSPVARLRDAARAYHALGSKSELKWSGIRAERLSNSHGEFCKLFCGKTSRELDFFEERGTQSGEQLFNMIYCCNAFNASVMDKDKRGSVFCSLFDVDSSRNLKLTESLGGLKKMAVKIKDIRNKMAHNFLTLRADDFLSFRDSARTLLESLWEIDSCISGNNRLLYDEQLSNIESIAKRGLKIEDREIVMREKLNLLDEKARELEHMLMNEIRQEKQDHRLLENLNKAFDSLSILLYYDIKEHLTKGLCTFIHSAYPVNRLILFL